MTHVRQAGWLLALAAAVACSWFVSAAASIDGAVLTALRRADPSLSFGKVWHRTDVGDGLDLAIAVSSASRLYAFRDGRVPGGIERIGLYLQRRDNPATVFQLAFVPGSTTCGAASVARATRFDTVIWCEDEKFVFSPARKFVYDVRAKRLVAQFEFHPFTHITAKHVDENRLTLTARSIDRRVRLSLTPPDNFTVMTVERQPPPPGVSYRLGGEVVGRRFGTQGAFTLVEIPGTETEECGSDNPEIGIRSGARRYRLAEKDCSRMGPAQALQELGDRFWFGKQFYNGEGFSGTGGFGYFDMGAGSFRTIAGPEIKEWSTTAIRVIGESVWLALASHGEYADLTGGVLLYPSPGSKPRHIDIGHCVGREFVSAGESLYLLTDCGIVLVTPDGVLGHMIDVTSDGRVRVVPGLP